MCELSATRCTEGHTESHFGHFLESIAMHFFLISVSVNLLAIAKAAGESGCSGSFELDDNDQCSFQCDYNDEYISLSDIPFSVIRDKCINVEFAAKSYGCTKNDLIYGTDCGCPYCQCTNSNQANDFQSVYQYDVHNPVYVSAAQICYNCSCGSKTSIGINDTVYDCQDIEESNPWNWDYYTCPPVTCTYIDSVSNQTITINSGDSYFDNVGDSQACETFCYCKPDGYIECQTGMDNIINTDGINNVFQRKCQDVK